MNLGSPRMPRHDARAIDQLRPVKIRRGFVNTAIASVLIEAGNSHCQHHWRFHRPCRRCASTGAAKSHPAGHGCGHQRRCRQWRSRSESSRFREQPKVPHSAKKRCSSCLRWESRDTATDRNSARCPWGCVACRQIKRAAENDLPSVGR